ncbi:hypothetical protein AAFF_G00328740 [Aldrovandia affinis]|uniref:Protocadherin domain-containing protein n=1 Tax=Aldrovandia affinis TaxID=143900 RepID=A0AAD7WQ69_9TELE|nr:hypothetical protein AAFF_G00328740 [Aldrovandia affinis]
MVVIAVIFVAVLVRCRHASRFRAAQRKKQGAAEWMSPNQEGKQGKKRRRKKRKSPKNSLLNFVTIEDAKPHHEDDEDDAGARQPINGAVSLPAELEEQGIGRFDWTAGPPTSTFKPGSPDLARHYKSASPQSAFHLKADTPVLVKKHHVIQELPLDNTFVGGGCDTLSKRSSTSSDHFSASECSSQGGFKPKGPLSHGNSRQGMNGDGIRTFDPGGKLPKWTWRGGLSSWPLDIGRSALPRSELRRRVCGSPRGCPRKWLPGLQHIGDIGAKETLHFPAGHSTTPERSQVIGTNEQLKAIWPFKGPTPITWWRNRTAVVEREVFWMVYCV